MALSASQGFTWAEGAAAGAAPIAAVGAAQSEQAIAAAVILRPNSHINFTPALATRQVKHVRSNFHHETQIEARRCINLSA
jgi:hypothetical protein